MKKLLVTLLASLVLLAGCGSSNEDQEQEQENQTPAVTYKDGTYKGSAVGLNDEVKLTVVVEGGVIKSVTIDEHHESEGVSDPAINELPGEIVAANGTEGVDVKSGCTFSSKAILEAVDTALAEAK